MSYTHKALALVWILLLAFFGLAGSGAVTGPWLVLLIAAALVMPAMLSRMAAKPESRPGDAVPVTPVGRLAHPGTPASDR
jgi:hypothetical protein